MRSYRYLHLDVFTDRLFGGNQLAVILDGRGLADDTMQAIAKEMNFSETTFVLPAEVAGTDVRVRIFTPDAELPMAGHPTIGTAFALARTGVLVPGRAETVFGLTVGPTPVSLTWKNGELSFAWMRQQRPVFGVPIADPSGVAAALRLSGPAMLATGLPVQTVSCGVPYLLVPLASRSAVDGASLDVPAYDAFLRAARIAEVPLYLFTTEKAGDQSTTYSRMFVPGLSVTEDAATGSAAGPLGCYLVRHNLVRADEAGSMLNRQGVKMGRPSHIHISIGVEQGEIASVRVGGESVLAGEGTLYV